VLEDPEAQLGRVVRPRASRELGEPRYEDLDAVAGLVEQEDSLLEFAQELLGGGAFLLQSLPGRDRAQGQVLGRLGHVQELLGHAQLDSTMRYTRVAVCDLVKVIERSHPREREWARRGRHTQ
jgi:hypothetical protein